MYYSDIRSGIFFLMTGVQQYIIVQGTFEKSHLIQILAVFFIYILLNQLVLVIKAQFHIGNHKI